MPTKKSLSEFNILDIGHSIQLTGAIYSNKERSWLARFPEEASLLPVEDLVMSQDDWARFLLQTDVLEVETNDGVKKAIVRKSQRHIEQAVSWRVFKRDCYTCRYCGRDDVPLTVDHAPIPWEKGGPSVEYNLVSSCRKCNRAKANDDYGTWLASPYYRNASKTLSTKVKETNSRLFETIANIQTLKQQRSR